MKFITQQLAVATTTFDYRCAGPSPTARRNATAVLVWTGRSHEVRLRELPVPFREDVVPVAPPAVVMAKVQVAQRTANRHLANVPRSDQVVHPVSFR